MSFATQLLMRATVSDPSTMPASEAAPGSAFRVIPIGDCSTLVGTCEPGGCAGEHLCTWAKQ
ncbi:MAG: hypothetical protein JWO36_4458 [Myxococcales bacterium]|nr:hypothetical protein [Myxococcales bacterium]